MKTKIKDMNLELRPRERLKKLGVKYLASDELLAILLHHPYPSLLHHQLHLFLVHHYL